MNRQRFKGMTSFLDMLWILLAGFGAMFIIAFLLIQPPAKNADIIKKAEYIIVLSWDSEVGDDIDLWVRDPKGVTVSFKNKTGGFMNLEKDDLGRENDAIQDEYGNVTVVKINRETTTLRGTVPGEYEVMIHVYSREFVNSTKPDARPGAQHRREGPVEYSVEVIKINPYKIVYATEGVYDQDKQEISIVRFTIGDDHKFEGFNNNPSNIINMTTNSYDGNSIRPGGEPRL